MTNNSQANSRHIFSLWGRMAAPLLATVAAFIFFGASERLLLLGLIPLAFLFYTFQKGGTEDHVQSLFRTSASVEPILAYYRRSIRPGSMPDHDAILAQACALACIFYGESEQADDTLDSVEWSDRPPLIQALREAAFALKCIILFADSSAGLKAARRAFNLGRLDPSVPGAKTSEAAFSSYIELAQIVNGQMSPRLLETLEARQKDLPLLGRFIVWWGLAVACNALEDPRSAHWEELLKSHAPHCKPLLTFR